MNVSNTTQQPNDAAPAAASRPDAAQPQAAGPTPAQAARAVLKQFQEQFPVFRDCQPLAIGIDKQLMERVPGLTRKVLRLALGIHTGSLRYLKAMEKATVRYDLDGQTRDEVTEEHRAHASQTLRERFKKNAEQKKAQQAAARARQEAEEAAAKRADKLNQLAAKFAKR